MSEALHDNPSIYPTLPPKDCAAEPSGVTPLRAVRVPDLLWEAAQDAARDEGRTLSEVIRDLLSEWVAEHNPDW